MMRSLLPSSRLARVSLALIGVLSIACADLTRAKATYTSASSSFLVYTLTGSSAAVPNAISLLTGPTRATSAFGFDIAFEIDAAGRPVVYPVRTLASSLATINGTLKRVGLQVVPGGYDALLEVPATGYDTVNARTLVIGSALALELRDASSCYSLTTVQTINQSQLLYAKLVVDSVDIPNHRVYGRTVVDPNCGYRGVVPDSIPRN